ncbi:MAG TPA: ECF-type sigma factor [Longimicrobiaceae bacterium]
MEAPASEVTRLLHRWSDGDEGALARLIPILYERLRWIARQRLRGAAAEHSLNTTGLVHEAYIRMVEAPHRTFRDRSHFLALASRVMRCLLADHARARMAAKRGAGAARMELKEAFLIPDDRMEAIAELDEALARLEALDPRQARILEQRYFGGLSLEETAAAMDLSLATVKRELRSARAWLLVELTAEPPLP